MMTQQDFCARFAPKAGDVYAIDGPCGSGKTSFALYLQHHFDVDVVHLDDFFLPAALRTDERFATLGGSVHHERFLQEVLQPLQAGKAFSYRRFDCQAQTLAQERTIPNTRAVVIEGSFSLLPLFLPYYTQTICLCVRAETQHRRIQARNGDDGLARFQALWIPREQAYFDAYQIPQSAHVLLSGEDATVTTAIP